jgi:hypothetical protein
MTRGRRPLTALREAVRIAQKRGEVRHFAHEREMICNFVIYCALFVAHVRIKRVRRLRITPELLEREAREELAVLRSIAYTAGISRELWVCSPKGSFRFFRVTDTGLIEITKDGLLMPRPAAPPALPPGTVPVIQQATPVEGSGSPNGNGEK